MTEQQARAYLALLDVDTSNVNDLARLSRVPRAKLYEVLEGLSRKGLLDTIPGTPQRFRANPLTALYDTRVEELRAEERQLKRSIGDLMVTLLPTPKESNPESERDFLHLAKGRSVFAASVRHLVERAQRSILIVGDRLVLPRLRLYEDLYQRLTRFQSAGELRVVVPQDAVLAIEGRRVHIDEIVDAVRATSAPGGDAMTLIVDEAEFLDAHFLPNDLHPSRGSDRITINKDAEMAALRARIVRLAWESGAPLVSGLASNR